MEESSKEETRGEDEIPTVGSTNQVAKNGETNEAQCKISEDVVPAGLRSRPSIAKPVGVVDKVRADSSSLTPPSSPDGKRQKSNSVRSPSSPLPPFLAGVSASPPKFVALEEIMKAANGVSNLYLAHEIAVNTDFCLKKADLPETSIRKKFEVIMKQAFWDHLQSQLNETPTNYKQALILLEEVKENLLSFLLPQHTRLKQEIEEILDLDLIKQQAENGALDFQRYAQYVLSVMARLCAPVRDEKIRDLTQTNEVVPLFRGIMELLEVMKLDMANFAIKQVRPHILQQSVAYERQKFKEYLEQQAKLGVYDTLEYTKKWLKRNYDQLDLSQEPNLRSKINKVATAAYIELLTWDSAKQEFYPETLSMDRNRFEELHATVRRLTLVGSVLLITFATLGSALQDQARFKEQLKEHLKSIIGDESEVDAKQVLEGAALQTIEDANKYISEHQLKPIEASKSSLLKTQIVDIGQPDNRVRNIVQRRILEFMETVITSNTAAPVKMPAGMSTLQEELSSVTGQFMKIVTHNRAVFGEYYAAIVEEFHNSSV